MCGNRHLKGISYLNRAPEMNDVKTDIIHFNFDLSVPLKLGKL